MGVQSVCEEEEKAAWVRCFLHILALIASTGICQILILCSANGDTEGIRLPKRESDLDISTI